MRRTDIRLSRSLEWSVYTVLALAFLSGAIWASLTWRRQSNGGFGLTAYPSEIWTQRLHGAVAMLVLVLVGRLIASHVPAAWRARRNRRTGGALAATIGFLIVSGYLLYYAGDERLRVWVTRGHLWVGLAFPLIIALHVYRGKRSRGASPYDAADP